MLGLAAHVPGGVGVFEGLMVLLLKPFLPSAQLVPALIVYRVLYYAIPLAIAVSALLVDEAWLRRAHAVRAAAFIGRLAEQVTPRLLAALTFAAGMVLLFSGATPAAEHRLALLHHLVPLGIIEDVARHRQHYGRRPAVAVAGAGPPPGCRVLPHGRCARRGNDRLVAPGGRMGRRR